MDHKDWVSVLTLREVSDGIALLSFPYTEVVFSETSGTMQHFLVYLLLFVSEFYENKI